MGTEFPYNQFFLLLLDFWKMHIEHAHSRQDITYRERGHWEENKNSLIPPNSEIILLFGFDTLLMILLHVV